MINKIAILEKVRNLGVSAKITDVETSLAKRDVMSRIAEKKNRYRVELWDKKSAINGIPAEKILSSRNDIPEDGYVYLVYIDDRVVYFQPTPPGEPGMRAMGKDEALAIADKHITELAQAEAETEISNEVIEELLRTLA